MIPVLSRAEMRAFDAHAIKTCGVPSLVLMENAGRGAADVIERELLGGRAQGKRVVVVAGAGNNGGDGFVVARRLLTRGALVEAWLAGDPKKLTPDCRDNHDAFLGLGGVVHTLDLGSGAPRLADVLRIAGADVVVDAIFGTGLDRAVVDPLASLVAALNEGGAPIAALDVPSGMDSDTGRVLGVAVRASITVTFAHPKLGHLTPGGARLTGALHVVDIGVPPALTGALTSSARLVETDDVRRAIAPRAVDAHKYRAGHVAIVAGSAGKVGAALLCAHGAMRAGAGAATIGTWPDAALALEARVLEVMTARLADDASSTSDAAAVAKRVDALLVHKRAVVVGPGFGTDARAKSVVSHVLATFEGPIVLDADALSMFAGTPEAFAVAKGRAILTPHAGELARLLGKTSDEIEANRFDAVRAAAARANATVLLKGTYTLVASPDGALTVNATGNPALATAGSGDVLSGIIGALACHVAPAEAARFGAWLHGASGDAWAALHGDRGLLASEIADGLPDVLRTLSVA